MKDKDFIYPGLVKQFLNKIIVEEGLSANSVDAYKRDLKLFIQFLSDNKILASDKELINVTSKILKNYIHELNKQQLEVSSINRKITVLKSFYNFLFDEQIITFNPALELEQPKKPRKLPNILSEEEILKLLDMANKDCSEFGIRLACLLEILYASGLRVSELVSLPISALSSLNNVQSCSNYLLVKGKGNKERIVLLGSAALKALKKYLEIRKESLQQDSKWLFVGKNSNSKNEIRSKKILITARDDKHLTRQRLHQMLKELAVKAGIDPKKVHPHVIRHSFATHLLNQGMDLRMLQELLGHSDISTTQIYTHILDSKFKELVFKHHPLAKQK